MVISARLPQTNNLLFITPITMHTEEDRWYATRKFLMQWQLLAGCGSHAWRSELWRCRMWRPGMAPSPQLLLGWSRDSLAEQYCLSADSSLLSENLQASELSDKSCWSAHLLRGQFLTQKQKMLNWIIVWAK